jgi:hypothetical protein
MPVTAKPPQRVQQLALFSPPQPGGLWEMTPPQSRQQIERLLGRMLREHAVRRLDEPAAREVGGE